MAAFIVNPRRAPRAPARCRAAVVSPSGAFDGETEDIGAGGCQVVSPGRGREGDAIALVLSTDRFPDELRVTGKVAWASGQPPWRMGIAFDDAHVAAGQRFFDKLVAATPGLASLRRVPERIPFDATVYLGPPPRFLVDFSAEEAELLRAIGSGSRLDELVMRLRDRWPAAQRALFSLVARQAVTFSRGNAAHPDAWKRILTEVEASLAVESLGSVAEMVPEPPAAARRDPTPPLGHPLATPRPGEAPPPARAPAASWPGTPAPGNLAGPPRAIELDAGPLPAGGVTPRGASRADAGAGWGRSPPVAEGSGTPRTAEAQAIYERALAEVHAGRVNAAIALLRLALQQCPGDPEIRGTLGRLASAGRPPGSR